MKLIKPECHGKHSRTWPVCEKCGFRTSCQLLTYGTRSNVYTSPNSMVAEAEEFNRRQKAREEGRAYKPTPTIKKVIKRSVRLRRASVTDVNLAIMFGIGKYAEQLGYMNPSQLLQEFKAIKKGDDGVVKERRIELIRQMVNSGPRSMINRFKGSIQGL